MGADLRVTSVVLPSPLQAPCPVLVEVTVTNVGIDPADPVPFIVAVELRTGESGTRGATTRFRARVSPPEGGQLSPGDSTVAVVTVRFPCTAPVELTAIADAAHQVPNNDATDPSVTVVGLTPTSAPWLVASLRVGITNGYGIVSWTPPAFCPGKTLVAEVTVTNQGCKVSRPSTVEVVLEDVTASPAVVLDRQYYRIHALAPGASTWPQFALPIPALGASASHLGVRVDADAKGENPDQCDRSTLAAHFVRPISSGGPPRLTLGVGGAVHPGEAPQLTWSLVNECSAIDLAHVTISFGAPAVTLWDDWMTIPPQVTVGQSLTPGDLTIPPAILPEFWTLGTHDLELVVAGNGADGGPYQVTAPMVVVPDAVDATWWTWTGAAASAWKSSYPVSGRLRNRSLAAMSLTGVSFTEHPADIVGTSQDVMVSVVSTPTVPVAAGASASFATRRNPAWTWIAKGAAVEVGPRSRTFFYTASFDLTDAFGNVYPTVTSSPTSVVISVSALKLSDREIGAGFVGAGLAMLALAAGLAVFGGPYGWIAAVIVAAAAMTLIILGQLLLYDAFDPPIPEFRDNLAAVPDPESWLIPEVDDEELRPLRSLVLLLARVASTTARAAHHRDRAWAAYVDLDDEALDTHRAAAQREIERLRRLADACVSAADESREVFDRLTTELSMPRSDDVRTVTTRSFDELGLRDGERAIVEQWVTALEDRDRMDEALADLRRDGLTSVSTLVEGAYAATRDAVVSREYLGAGST